MKFLIDSGSDIDSLINGGILLFGVSSLTLACGKNNLEIVKLLINNKAKLHNGVSVLSNLYKSHDTTILKFLLDNGLNVYYKYARNSYHFPKNWESNCSPEVVECIEAHSPGFFRSPEEIERKRKIKDCIIS